MEAEAFLERIRKLLPRIRARSGTVRRRKSQMGAVFSAAKVSRPEPSGYFLDADSGAGLLPWSHVVDRMGTARNYWVATTGANGLPHCMPVWGVWLDEEFVFSTSPASWLDSQGEGFSGTATRWVFSN